MPLQLGDVPAPELIRRSGQELWLLIRRMGELIATLTSFTLFFQNPVNRAQRAVINTLVQESRIYCGWRVVLEAFLMQTGEHSIPLRQAERAGRNCFHRWTEDGPLLPVET